MIPTKQKPLRINSNFQSLRLVERLIEDVCQVYNVSDERYGNMLIAVTEAVNNAICHGNKNEHSKIVKIGFEHQNNQLVFSVIDEGEGFDFTRLEDPTDPENIEKAHGRGVFLMTQLSDFIQFENSGRKVLLGFNA